MLAFENLTRQFNGRNAVENISLKIDRGSFVGVIGPSGAGKSTLLRMVNRIVDPSSGSITYNNNNVTALRGARVRAWRRSCAMVFQQFNLVGRLDVLTNVMMGRLNRISTTRALLNLWSDEDKAVALSALEMFGMAQFASQRADKLSGGQQQRVAIARALVQEPEIILADEPIASLDPRNTKIVMDALARINLEYGITILCNLHSLDLARTYCSRLIGMSSGRVVFDGSPETLSDEITQKLYGLEEHDVRSVEKFDGERSWEPAPAAEFGSVAISMA